jgi:hypothetical protein
MEIDVKSIKRTCENCRLCEIVTERLSVDSSYKCSIGLSWCMPRNGVTCHAAITDEDIMIGQREECMKRRLCGILDCRECISDSFKETQNLLAKTMPQPSLSQLRKTKTYQQSTRQEQRGMEKEYVKLQSLHRSEAPSNDKAGKGNPSRTELLQENKFLNSFVKVQRDSIDKRFDELGVANMEIELLKSKLELAGTENAELQEMLSDTQRKGNQLLKETKAHEKENTLLRKALDAFCFL